MKNLPEQRAIWMSVPSDPRELSRMSRHVHKKGRGPGSLEPEETAGLDYWVMNTSMVRERLPVLWDLFNSLPPLVSEVLGIEVECGTNEGALNVNMLVGRGSRYELHYDTEPFTMMTYITNFGTDHIGGELFLREPDGKEHYIIPIAGSSLIFDGAACAHSVCPLLPVRNHNFVDCGVPVRISVPMAFLPVGVGHKRPAGTDNHLYT
jgi:hypothetical protein